MNIERLTKHLKEFSLDEIELIAECNCKTELEQLLNENKLVLEQGVYKYVENKVLNFDIFDTGKIKSKNKSYSFEYAVQYFMKKYVSKYCKDTTYIRYKRQFRYDIAPYFEDKKIKDIAIHDIQKYYFWCKERNFKPAKMKNTFALLKQFLKYFQENGLINNKCTFQVRRITVKNEINLNRITFGGIYDKNEIL